MSAPKRIQLRRTKGWRKPEGVIVVARPSRWGNPFRVRRAYNDGQWDVVVSDPGFGDVMADYADSPAEARAIAVDLFRMAIHPAALKGSLPDYPLHADIERELRGRDLACWCPLDQPCHADVLLEIANGGAS